MPDETLSQINQKLDLFMQFYKDRHIDLEKRVDKVEQRVDVIDTKINGLHNQSMQWVNDALQGLERRILDKIEANSTFSHSQWVIIGIAVIGWLIGIVSIVVAILK